MNKKELIFDTRLVFFIKKLLNFLLASFLLSLEIITVYLFLFESPEMTTSELLISLIFYSIFIYFTFRYFISNLIPKYFKEMRVVHKYITFSELKDLLKDEVFKPVDFPNIVLKILSKSKLKSFNKEFLISDNWVCINKMMIPKKMISSIRARAVRYYATSNSDTISNLDITCIDLLNGKSYEFGPLYQESKKLINYLNKGNEIANLRDTKDKVERINNFKKEIITKEQFLEFIK